MLTLWYNESYNTDELENMVFSFMSKATVFKLNYKVNVLLLCIQFNLFTSLVFLSYKGFQ